MLIGVCTLMRSVSGIVLGPGRIISPTFLSKYLERLDDHDEESVKKLLYPSDPQDVPRAVELMRAIADVRKLNLESSDPSEIADVDAIRLLSELCDSLLEAYINPKCSLSEQVTSLSKFAHLSFAFFRAFRTQYMSNQLYGDSQCMVKNAMFCIAKQQVYFPTQPFHLFELGDDRLEKLFGRIRMLGAHDSGMRYNQGVDRLGHAVDIDAVLARNPDLDSGQRRLKVENRTALDHLNNASWDGDAAPTGLTLPSSWDLGRHYAKQVVLASSMSPEYAEFEEILGAGTVDLLCAFEAGKYPGVDDLEPDRSMPEDAVQQPAQGTAPATDTQSIHSTDTISGEATSNGTLSDAIDTIFGAATHATNTFIDTPTEANISEVSGELPAQILP